MDCFANLAGTGRPLSDVTRFLEAAGHGVTLAHCQAVAEQARELAARFCVDVGRANLAAVCHDLAAVVPHEQAVAVAEEMGLAPVFDNLKQGPILQSGRRRCCCTVPSPPRCCTIGWE